MKNLKVTSHSAQQLSPIDPKSAVCVDTSCHDVYFVNKSCISVIRKVDDEYGVTTIASWEDHDIEIGEIVALEFQPILQCMCIVAKQDIVTVSSDDHVVEVAGSVCDGILGAKWSPDLELLALVTTSHSLVLMTMEFDPIAEISLEQEEFGENKFVNVGWGKKETQFHGSVGKDAAKEAKPKATPIFEWDDQLPRITWRGDGQLFAVSYVAQDSKTRVFRVISREGNILSRSEPVEGLEFALSWKPSGNLIASTRRLSNKHNVCFFEKNGLMHNEFTLPYKASEVIVEDLLWNLDSSLLLVWIKFFDREDSILQFWKVGNYHWYLKKVLRFKELLHVHWHEECPLLLLAAERTILHSFQFKIAADISRGKTSSDLSLVSVIDGKKLLITPFRNSVVPPPISAYEVEFPDEIDAVCFAPPNCKAPEIIQSNALSNEDSGFLETIYYPGSSSNDMFVIHGNDKITFLTLAKSSEQLSDCSCVVTLRNVGLHSKVHKVFSQYKLDSSNLIQFDDKMPERYYNWTWISTNVIIVCCEQYNKQDLVVFEMEEEKMKVSQVFSLGSPVVDVIPSPNGSTVCLLREKCPLVCFEPLRGDGVVPWLHDGSEVVIPFTTLDVVLCPVSNKLAPVSLTFNNRLYLGNLQLLSDVTSILVHNDHLLITTTAHSLLVIPLKIEALLSLPKGVKTEFSEVGLRRIERGARLITSVACDTKVLMQMPRGNLEMVSPRTLVVHNLKSLLNQHDYSLAVDVMRKQRIDMNLLYDHNPKDFLAHLGNFVESVKNPHWIDLFIANLTEDDVTKTFYACNYAEKIEGARQPGKIQTICNAIRQAMISIDEEEFLLPILTSYVKSSDSDLETALAKLYEMKKSNEKFKVSFEEGLSHLLLLADADQLCNVALGTYNFDLIMLVYERSQKDPKEYLPFLNSLQKLEKPYCRFKMDVHLKRFKSALQNLCQCGEKYTDEGLELICKEKLYSTALGVFPKKSGIYNNVCKAYADYLSSKGHKGEAAIMYTRAFKLREALDAYVSAVDWKGALTVAFQLKLSQRELNDLCLELIQLLKERECHSEIAVIYERYLHNEEEAVESYLKAFNWRDALLLACSHQRSDLVDVNIKSAVLECYKSFQTEIPEKLESFVKRCERLSAVRTAKEKEFEASKDIEDQLDADLYSDASTVTGVSHQRSLRSTSSIKTYRSTKNKRKLERKKYSTKEGSTYEDLGLVVTLHDSMCEIDSLATSICGLNSALVYFEEDQKAKQLQTAFEDLLAEAKKRKDVIWLQRKADDETVEFGPQMSSEAVLQKLNSQSSFSFINRRMSELEAHYQIPPTLKNCSWKLVSLK